VLLISIIKGIVHPKIKFPSSFSHPHVQGLKLNFVPHLPMAGDLRKCTGHKYFFTDHETVFAKTSSSDTKILDTSENSQFSFPISIPQLKLLA